MPNKLWWLSFADSQGKFLGVVVIKASSFPDAHKKTHELGVNPGGQIQGQEVHDIPDQFHDRLLLRQELIGMNLGESTLA